MKQAWHRLPRVVLATLVGGTIAWAQETGLVESATIIREFEIEELDGFDRFGCAVTVLGDIDGDGTREIAVGASNNRVASSQYGAVFVISLDGSGAVVRHNRIAEGLEGFDPGEVVHALGLAVAAIGDLDGDGISELAASSTEDPLLGCGEPTVWILFLDGTGAVRSWTAIGGRAGRLSAGPDRARRLFRREHRGRRRSERRRHR